MEILKYTAAVLWLRLLRKIPFPPDWRDTRVMSIFAGTNKIMKTWANMVAL